MKLLRHIPVSRLRIRTKFLLILFLLLLTVLMMLGIAFHGFFTKEQQKRDMAELLTVTASDQYLGMTIENSVSIAKSIYINDSLYQFLNTDYKSSTAYFEAYRKFVKENPLALADANIIDSYKIYTENTTIMSGNDIRSLQSAENDDWYKTIKKFGKTMILYCDTSKDKLSIIRKLDYNSSDFGENYLKLDLNTSLFVSYCSQMQFEGQIYIICDGTLLYSNQTSSDIPAITQDFYSLTQNYYTTDIEYYALAEQAGFAEFFQKEWVFLLLFALILSGTVFLQILLIKDIQHRTQTAVAVYQKEGNLSEFALQGCDEISDLTELVISLSEKFVLRNQEYKNSQEQFQQKTSDYHILFGQALYLDAILQIYRNYPDIQDMPHTEWHSLSSELTLLRTFRNGMILPENLSGDEEIPVFSLLLAANALSSDDNALTLSYDNTSLSLCANITLKQEYLLKLQAIFEEGEISDSCRFKPEYLYNPFLRLKYYFGDRVTLLTDNDIIIQIKLT